MKIRTPFDRTARFAPIQERSSKTGADAKRRIISPPPPFHFRLSIADLGFERGRIDLMSRCGERDSGGSPNRHGGYSLPDCTGSSRLRIRQCPTIEIGELPRQALGNWSTIGLDYVTRRFNGPSANAFS